MFDLFGRDDEFALLKAEFNEAEFSDHMSMQMKNQSDQDPDQVPERDFMEVMMEDLHEKNILNRPKRYSKIDTSKWKF